MEHKNQLHNYLISFYLGKQLINTDVRTYNLQDFMDKDQFTMYFARKYVNKTFPDLKGKHLNIDNATLYEIKEDSSRVIIHCMERPFSIDDSTE